MCKNHKPSLDTYRLIFANNSEAKEKILLGFCRGNQSDANVCAGLQKYIIPASLQHSFVLDNMWGPSSQQRLLATPTFS